MGRQVGDGRAKKRSLPVLAGNLGTSRVSFEGLRAISEWGLGSTEREGLKNGHFRFWGNPGTSRANFEGFQSEGWVFWLRGAHWGHFFGCMTGCVMFGVTGCVTGCMTDAWGGGWALIRVTYKEK